jgi:hypothetical protein
MDHHYPHPYRGRDLFLTKWLILLNRKRLHHRAYTAATGAQILIYSTGLSAMTEATARL